MISIRRMLARISAFFAKQGLDKELDDELDAHIAFAVEDNLKRGMSPEEARRTALAGLGGIEAAKELHRDARGLPALETFLQDLRYALRGLRLRPGTTLTAVTTIAVAVGATTAVYSVVDGVLLRPLPYPEPDRLARIWQTNTSWMDSPKASLGVIADRLKPSAPTYRDWLNTDTGFESLGAYVDASYVLQSGDGSEVLKGQEATSGFFETLGAAPILGRALLPADDAFRAPRVVVLSEPFWRSRFGGKSQVLGSTLMLDGAPHTVVGVMPDGFQGPSEKKFRPMMPAGSPLLWTALTEEARRGWKNVSVIGRIEPGLSLDTVAERFAAVHATLAKGYPEHERDKGVRVEGLLDSVVGDVRSTLWFLLGSVALVLIVAMVNIANILTALGLNRGRELAVRAALGAGSGRLMRGRFVESAVPATLGGLGGILIAWGGLPVLLRFLPPTVPRHESIGMSTGVLLCGILATGVTALLVGTLPAALASRVRPQEAMRGSGRGLTSGRASGRVRSLLVVAEVSLAFVLLVVAGLLGGSYARLSSVERGFDTEGLAAMWAAPDRTAYPTRDDRRRFAETLRRRLEAIPGVRASVSNNLPLSGISSGTLVRLERDSEEPEEVSGLVSVGLNNYFDVIGIRLLSGRGFEPSDTQHKPPVAIVNETMARTYWPGEEAIGRRLKVDESDWIEVVGVAEDLLHMGLSSEVEPKLYLPASQTRRSTNQWVLRIRGDVPAALARARETVAGLSASTPVTSTFVLDRTIANSIAVPRFRTFFIVGLAGLAGVLALLGLYGVLTFAVAQRTKEISIRMALGARAGGVVAGIVGSGLKLATAGVVIGLVIAWSMAGVVGTFLFQIKPTHPLTYLGVVAGVLAVSCGAAFLPARRAAGVDPARVLSDE